MIFKQLFDNKSSTYTYLLASDRGREALIIDPVIENTDEYITLVEWPEKVSKNFKKKYNIHFQFNFSKNERFVKINKENK